MQVMNHACYLEKSGIDSVRRTAEFKIKSTRNKRIAAKKIRMVRPKFRMNYFLGDMIINKRRFHYQIITITPKAGIFELLI